MRFTKLGDNEWLNELVEHDVVRKGFDGLTVREGLDVFGHILLNAAKIDPVVWLQWLTSGRGLLRLASVSPNPDWIGTLPLSLGQRSLLADAVILPCFESAGAWVCASLKPPADRGPFEKLFGVRMVFVAPTPVELAAIYKHYQQ